MTEGTGSDIEDGDFEDLMLESDVRGYLYEPQYSDEQLKLIEEQEAAAAATAKAEDRWRSRSAGVASEAVHGGAWWELLSSIHKRQKVTFCLFSVKTAPN